MGRILIEMPARHFQTAFERTDLVATLQSRIAEAGKEVFAEGEKLLKSLQQDNSERIKLTYIQEGRFVRIAAALIEEGKGEVFCSRCSVWYSAQDLERQQVHYGDGGALSGGDGRLWQCSDGHHVLVVHDSRA